MHQTTGVPDTRADDGAEHDVVCRNCRRNRRFRPGVTSLLKRKINKRTRRTAKSAIRAERHELMR